MHTISCSEEPKGVETSAPPGKIPHHELAKCLHRFLALPTNPRTSTTRTAATNGDPNAKFSQGRRPRGNDCKEGNRPARAGRAGSEGQPHGRQGDPSRPG